MKVKYQNVSLKDVIGGDRPSHVVFKCQQNEKPVLKAFILPHIKIVASTFSMRIFNLSKCGNNVHVSFYFIKMLYELCVVQFRPCCQV